MYCNKESDMSYIVFKHNKEFGPRKGLEGPFHYPNGQVLYYDPKEGEYYDPLTDFYVPLDEVNELQNTIFEALKVNTQVLQKNGWLEWPNLL